MGEIFEWAVIIAYSLLFSCVVLALSYIVWLLFKLLVKRYY